MYHTKISPLYHPQVIWAEESTCSMILGTEANLIGEAGNSNLDEWIAWEDNEYKRLKKKKGKQREKRNVPEFVIFDHVS